jgi:hypothetical protein
VIDPAIPAPDSGAFEAYVRSGIGKLESWVNALSSGPHVCNRPRCNMRKYGL